MDINRKEDESKLDYLKRIVYGKLVDKTIKEKYKELSMPVFGVQLSECECRKRFYGIHFALEVLQKSKEDSITDEKILDEILLEKLEIQKERKKIQTINLEVNKNIRKIARTELTQEEILRCLREELEPLNIPPYIIRGEGGKEGILTISDVHFGREALVYGLKGEVLNKYDEEVFEKRMKELLDRTIEICLKENLEKLNLLLTGDLIDGMLRMTQLKKLQYGIIKSTIKFSEYMANWINELSNYINIEVHYCLGNHSQVRPLGSGNGDFPEENMENIIIWHLETRLENNPNVVIHNNGGDFIYFECKGLNIMASHGEERNLESAIKDYKSLYGADIDMFIAGHLHTKENKSVAISHKELSDVEYCRVKSICSIDDYSTKLRKSSGAGTSLFVIEEGKGKTITYDINLQII
ncbi:metallophosphoesterase [Clostridium perfringens]|nr:metallophosphoesterase [Clostridium perfringens]